MFKPRRMSSSVTTTGSRFTFWPLPAIARQGHAATSEHHAFLLEQDTLGEHAADSCPRADAALGIDHALPRHSLGTVTHRQAHHARAPRPAQPRRDLAVRGDPPFRYLHDQPPDTTLPGVLLKLAHAPISPNC